MKIKSQHRSMKLLFTVTITLICGGYFSLASVNASRDKSLTPPDTLIIKRVKIITCEKFTNQKSKFLSKYEKACSDWNLSEAQMIEIIKGSRLMDGQEFSYYFSVLPCSYKGEVIINDTKRYKFKLNAGSYVELYNSNESYYLGYFKKNKIFIQDPGIGEE